MSGNINLRSMVLYIYKDVRIKSMKSNVQVLPDSQFSLDLNFELTIQQYEYALT